MAKLSGLFFPWTWLQACGGAMEVVIKMVPGTLLGIVQAAVANFTLKPGTIVIAVYC